MSAMSELDIQIQEYVEETEVISRFFDRCQATFDQLEEDETEVCDICGALEYGECSGEFWICRRCSSSADESIEDIEAMRRLESDLIASTERETSAEDFSLFETYDGITL